LLSGSQDSSIKKWKVSTGELIWTIWPGGVASMLEFEGVLYAGVGSESFMKFNAESGTFIKSVRGVFDLI
jgi:hypothetical protein